MTPHDLTPPTSPPAPRRFLPLLLVLFVGSGCAALIYEIVWLQLLQLVIGSTAVSLGVLLGTFMGGMCLGSLLLPRLVSARRHPLRVYAAARTGHRRHRAGGAVRHAVCRAGLRALRRPRRCWASCCAGPCRRCACCRPRCSWARRCRRSRAGSRPGPRACRGWAFFTAATSPAPCSAACWRASTCCVFTTWRWRPTCLRHQRGRGRDRHGPGGRRGPVRGAGRPGAIESGAPRAAGAWAVYLAIALSGMSALGAEVVWTRLLSLMLGGTVYTFSLILAVFLIGLGIGSSLGAFLARRAASARLALGVCQWLLAAAIAWTAFMISRVAAVLADRPRAVAEPVVHVPTRPGALPLGRPAGGVPVGSELSAGAGGGRLARPGPRAAGRRGLCGQHGRRHRRRPVFSLLVIPAIGTAGAERVLIGLAAVAAWSRSCPRPDGARTGAPGRRGGAGRRAWQRPAGSPGA